LPGQEKSSPLFSNSCALFCTFLHFLALTQNSTLFFSNNSALFAQNRGVCGRCFPRALRSSRRGGVLLTSRPSSQCPGASVAIPLPPPSL
jgi:hypothetical protein